MKAHERRPVCQPRRQMTDVCLSTNFDARYWMQALGVTRFQLEEAVKAVGTPVAAVMDYLSVPERRHSTGI